MKRCLTSFLLFEVMGTPGSINVVPTTSRWFHGGELLPCGGHSFLFSPKVISTCFQYSEARAQMLGRPAHSLRPLSISYYTMPKCLLERESLQRQRSSWGVVAVVFSLRQKVESVYQQLLLPRRKPLCDSGDSGQLLQTSHPAVIVSASLSFSGGKITRNDAIPEGLLESLCLMRW